METLKNEARSAKHKLFLKKWHFFKTALKPFSRKMAFF